MEPAFMGADQAYIFPKVCAKSCTLSLILRTVKFHRVNGAAIGRLLDQEGTKSRHASSSGAADDDREDTKRSAQEVVPNSSSNDDNNNRSTVRGGKNATQQSNHSKSKQQADDGKGETNALEASAQSSAGKSVFEVHDQERVALDMICLYGIIGVKISGPVSKGDLVFAATGPGLCGVAVAQSQPQPGAVLLGKVVEDIDDDTDAVRSVKCFVSLNNNVVGDIHNNLLGRIRQRLHDSLLEGRRHLLEGADDLAELQDDQGESLIGFNLEGFPLALPRSEHTKSCVQFALFTLREHPSESHAVSRLSTASRGSMKQVKRSGSTSSAAAPVERTRSAPMDNGSTSGPSKGAPQELTQRIMDRISETESCLRDHAGHMADIIRSESPSDATSSEVTSALSMQQPRSRSRSPLPRIVSSSKDKGWTATLSEAGSPSDDNMVAGDVAREAFRLDGQAFGEEGPSYNLLIPPAMRIMCLSSSENEWRHLNNAVVLTASAGLFVTPRWGYALQTPFLLASTRHSDAELSGIAQRCVGMAYMGELIAQGENWEMLVEVALRDRVTDELPSGRFKFEIMSYNKKLVKARKMHIFETMAPLAIPGAVDLHDPEIRYLAVEDYGRKHMSAPDAPHRVFWVRQIATGRRDLMRAFDLKTRNMIGNTSMDPELAFFMANMVQAQPGTLAYDPFCGTASLLVPVAYFGGMTMGSDIAFQVVHGVGKTSRQGTGSKTRGPKENILANYEQYELLDKFGDVLVADAANPSFRQDILFDMIVADPPYGIREPARRIGAKDSRPVPEEFRDNRFPRSKQYGLGAVFTDLISFGAHRLVLGGRLAFWMPEALAEEFVVPAHRCFEVKAACQQILNRKLARRLVVMAKVAEPDASEPEAVGLNAEWGVRHHVFVNDATTRQPGEPSP
ncbi:uncharacterized protein MONBRDRAFT_38107 [Monosiga brevicollis MX1]|uniref:tRNA (guanine(10)-N(2))-methyltransferase n=1 Tax=Monosiga brevicollis TaxID=81824 RepID=A9V5Q5_MONBE|nr:uncharacterized protein MONBRDRAFT_38107 [Monosiga brevicollis MX1]EDQ87158.1 predicted protein [Monosiga brevicollis MX1]|eukprot:XP_001748101.1 hypothetical protein [Monosiga brevicollis MX1]